MEEGEKPTIVFDSLNNNEYKIIRENLKTKKQNELIKLEGNNRTIKFLDSSAEPEEIYNYFVVSSCDGFNRIKISNNIKLMSY